MNKQLKTILGVVLMLAVTLMIPAGVKAVTTQGIEFSQVTNNRVSGTSTYGGALHFNNMPFEQEHVKLFCNNVVQADVLTDVNGKFTMNTDNCFTGQDSYLEVEHNGIKFDSNHIKVPTGRHRFFSPAPTTDVTQDPAEVPEFGVIAGAVALVGALGIFVFRRKNN